MRLCAQSSARATSAMMCMARCGRMLLWRNSVSASLPTYSIAIHGWPSSVSPRAYIATMLGCFKLAVTAASRLKSSRATTLAAVSALISLERVLPLQTGVFDEINRRHTAGAKDAVDPIAGNLRRRPYYWLHHRRHVHAHRRRHVRCGPHQGCLLGLLETSFVRLHDAAWVPSGSSNMYVTVLACFSPMEVPQALHIR